MNRKTILNEISENSPEEQKPALIKFLDVCDTLNQWQAFTVCHWKKTGPLSYQGIRIHTFNNQEFMKFFQE